MSKITANVITWTHIIQTHCYYCCCSLGFCVHSNERQRFILSSQELKKRHIKSQACHNTKNYWSRQSSIRFFPLCLMLLKIYFFEKFDRQKRRCARKMYTAKGPEKRVSKWNDDVFNKVKLARIEFFSFFFVLVVREYFFRVKGARELEDVWWCHTARPKCAWSWMHDQWSWYGFLNWFLFTSLFRSSLQHFTVCQPIPFANKSVHLKENLSKSILAAFSLFLSLSISLQHYPSFFVTVV